MTITLESLYGRVLDPDSHEVVLPNQFGDVFGERAANLAKSNPHLFEPTAYNQFIPTDPDLTDTMAATPESVWEIKGSAAPSTANLDRRAEVLDVMGIKSQLVFPGMALAALCQAQGGFGVPSSPEQKAIAWDAVDAHNEWVCEMTDKYKNDRVRFVGVLGTSRPDATPDSIVKETQRLIDGGVKTIFTSTGRFVGGLSPADPSLDPFYAQLTDADVVLVTHPPGAFGFVSPAWEIAGGVRIVTVAGLSEQNFIAAMTLGGVFERHPTLRFGAIEVGSSWIGSLADHLDYLAAYPWDPPPVEASTYSDIADVPREHRRNRQSAHEHPTAVTAITNAEFGIAKLSMKPSEYIARNVRVTAHFFEPVETYIEHYPHLRDVYCYSTDYPHKEGQRWSMKTFYDQIAPLGDDIVEKFFCTNAELLFP
jgi:predicted TIM-barrel fold metal-dependent hydrolase